VNVCFTIHYDIKLRLAASERAPGISMHGQGLFGVQSWPAEQQNEAILYGNRIQPDTAVEENNTLTHIMERLEAKVGVGTRCPKL